MTSRHNGNNSGKSTLQLQHDNEQAQGMYELFFFAKSIRFSCAREIGSIFAVNVCSCVDDQVTKLTKQIRTIIRSRRGICAHRHYSSTQRDFIILFVWSVWCLCLAILFAYNNQVQPFQKILDTGGIHEFFLFIYFFISFSFTLFFNWDPVCFYPPVYHFKISFHFFPYTHYLVFYLSISSRFLSAFLSFSLFFFFLSFALNIAVIFFFLSLSLSLARSLSFSLGF